MPSIIPEGAITSAPARAWLTACSARSGKVASLSTSTRPPRFRQRAAMAVVGVLAEAEVGDHQQLRRLPLGQPDRLLDDPVVGRRRRAAGVLVLGDAEEQDRRDAQLGHLGDRLAQPVERELILARHRRDLAPQVLAVIDEQRIDQVVHAPADVSRTSSRSRGCRGGGGADAADSRRRAGTSFVLCYLSSVIGHRLSPRPRREEARRATGTAGRAGGRQQQ